jgi:hypothetical protein
MVLDLESIEIIFQLLFFMFCLCVLGEPWRIIIWKFAGLFESLDFLQILIVDVFLGGFLLYLIAIVPLHLFTATTTYTITISSGVVAALFHRRKFRSAVQSLSLHSKSLLMTPHSLEIIIVASMFLFSLFVYTSPFSRLIFGSVRDTSLHSNFIQLLIENKQIPETEQPYSSAGIIYPQGHSAIAAFSIFIWNYYPPEAIFYITGLFNALTILGAYFLGKTLSTRKYMGLSLAFVFTFVASWPKYITWGSNALVMSFPFYFVCLSFIVYLAKNKLKITTILAIGIMFGYLAVLHLQVYETLIVSLIIVWLYFVLKREKERWSGLQNVIAVTGFSLLVLSPFLYRGLVFYSYPNHNIGLPADVEVPPIQPGFSIISDGVVFFFEHLASSFLLQIVSLLLILASILVIIIVRRNSRIRNGELPMIGVATFLGQLLIMVLAAVFGTSYTSPLLVSAPYLFYPNQLLLYIPFYFLIAVWNFHFYRFFSNLIGKIAGKIGEFKFETKKFLVPAISVMLLFGAYSPFIYQSTVLDAGYLYGSYAVFSLTTEQDLQLILWIRDNLPKDTTILVNTFSSGTFIPSIANRKVVFLPHSFSYSVSYQKLVSLLEQNKLNTTTFDLMERFNITHVYVGIKVSPWDNYIHKWNPVLFLGNPNFKLVKNFGDAYLFQLKITDPNIVFFDDFEHAQWNDNKWQTYENGVGLGNITITSNYGYQSQRSLRIAAKAVYTVSEWKYMLYISREFFVQDNSDVTFSFYLNATEGFHGEDAFAVFVSNIYHTQSMIMTTPKGVYENYAHAISLGKTEGSFEFKGNSSLSKLWHQMFNSSLPNPFILEFVNLDFDGVENIAYVDNIQITSTPTR